MYIAYAIKTCNMIKTDTYTIKTARIKTCTIKSVISNTDIGLESF